VTVLVYHGLECGFVIQDVQDSANSIAVPEIAPRVCFQVHGRFHVEIVIAHGEVFHCDAFGLGVLLDGLIDKCGVHICYETEYD